MNRELLVIIDPQVDFISPEGFYARDHGLSQISQAVTNIEKLIFEWKGPIVVIYSDYSPGQFGEGNDMCIPGTPGHETGIQVVPHSYAFPKCEQSAFSSGEFTSFLADKHIEALHICGFLAEHCVRETALDGLNNGYRVNLITDCIGTGDNRSDKRSMVLKELNVLGCQLA